MTKNKIARTATPKKSASLHRKEVDAFLKENADPGDLILTLESRSEDGDRHLFDLYEKTMADFLNDAMINDDELADDAKVLHRVKAVSIILEPCARRAGFVMGFEYARRLLTGGPR
jgi:hypothetical protein